MHKTLTESLHLAGTVVAGSHQSKVRIHAGIPAAEPLHSMSGIIILDIVALTVGQTRYRYHIPDRAYKVPPAGELTGVCSSPFQPSSERWL